MNEKISITEQDIFNYVKYPEVLSLDKRKYLDNHKSEFVDEIKFCKSMENISPLIEDVENAETQTNIFILFPVNFTTQKINDKLTLAAASAELDKKIETKTFVDPKSQFLVRMVSTEKEKTLYIFSKEKDFKQAKLTLLPSKKTFHISPLESSIIIDISEEIEKISIEKFL